MYDFSVPFKKSSLIFMELLSSTFIALLLFFLTLNDVTLFDSPLMAKFLIFFLLFIFGFAFVFTTIRLFKPNDAVIVNQYGVTNNSSIGSCGFVPWAEIKSVSLNVFGAQTFITLDLYDPEKLISLLPFSKKLFHRMNQKMGYSGENISVSNLPITPIELGQKITESLYHYGNPEKE